MQLVLQHVGRRDIEQIAVRQREIGEEGQRTEIKKDVARLARLGSGHRKASPIDGET
jgi:hypothetical protein